MNRTNEIELLTNPACGIMMKNNYISSYLTISRTGYGIAKTTSYNFNKEYFN